MYRYILIFIVLLFSLGLGQQGQRTTQDVMNMVTQEDSTALKTVFPKYSDSVFNAIVTVGTEHHEIHEGDHYRIAGSFDLGSTDTSLVGFDVSSSTARTHMVYTFNTKASTTISFIKGGTYLRATEALTAINSDHDSINTTAADTIFTVPMDSTLVTRYGTTLFTYEIGSGQNTSGELGRGQEQVLAVDSLYYWHITSNAASNTVGYILEWYEHTPDN